jgi:hypothetical protein
MSSEYTASPLVEFKPADMLHVLNEKDIIISNGTLNLQHTFVANFPTFYVTYSRIPIRTIKKETREESIRKWQNQWEETTKEAIIKEFFFF